MPIVDKLRRVCRECGDLFVQAGKYCRQCEDCAYKKKNAFRLNKSGKNYGGWYGIN